MVMPENILLHLRPTPLQSQRLLILALLHFCTPQLIATPGHVLIQLCLLHLFVVLQRLVILRRKGDKIIRKDDLMVSFVPMVRG